MCDKIFSSSRLRRGARLFEKDRSTLAKRAGVIVAWRESFYLALIRVWLNVVDNTADVGLFFQFQSDSKFLRILKNVALRTSKIRSM
jgi:hypothetical protein